jgi:hypothetical protein
MIRSLLISTIFSVVTFAQGFGVTYMEKDYDPYTPISPLTILDFKKGSTALSKDGIVGNNLLLNQVMDLRSTGRLNDYLFRIRAYGDQGKKVSLTQNMHYATSRAEKVAQTLTTYGVDSSQIKISASTEPNDISTSGKAQKVEVYLVPEGSVFAFFTGQDFTGQLLFNLFLSFLIIFLLVKVYFLEKRLSGRY